MRLHANRGVFAGAVFAAFGLCFLVFGRNYAVGTTLRMGPGYIPMVVGWLLLALGLIISLRAAFQPRVELEAWALRPLLAVTAALLAFSWLIEEAGLVLTGAVAMLVAGLAARDFRVLEQMILSFVFAGFCSLLFVRLLDLSVPYWPPVLMR
jgi:hypothetical protein